MEHQDFMSRLELLDSMIQRTTIDNARIRQLKRSVYVLRKLLKEAIPSPYGPETPIVKHSLQ